MVHVMPEPKARKVPTWIRVRAVRDYIAVGMLDLAYDQLKMIDAKEQRLRAVAVQLERARRGIMRQ